MPITAIPSSSLDSHGRGYPRPLLRRKEWASLNDDWDFAIDPDGAWQSVDQVEWTTRIRVPFSPEAPLSGLAHGGLFRACWYRRRCALPARAEDERWILHFGAVDWAATVWINGRYACDHEGGYTPFAVDITDLARTGECEVVVRAEDDPLDLAKPRGKQDWQLEPHSIWYPRRSGIWQTVWLEKVAATRIGRLTFTPNLARWEIGLGAWIDGDRRSDLQLGVHLRSRGMTLAADTYRVVSGEVHRGIALSDPGIDDSRNELLWSPHAPNLIDVDLELRDRENTLIDCVHSYTALRSAAVQGDRFLLNGRPYPSAAT